MLGSWYSFGYEGFPKEDRRRFLRQRDDPCDSDEERGGIGMYDDGLRCFRTFSMRRRKVRRPEQESPKERSVGDGVSDGEAPTSDTESDDDADDMDRDVLNFSDEDESDSSGELQRRTEGSTYRDGERRQRTDRKRRRSTKYKIDASALLVERAVHCGAAGNVSSCDVPISSGSPGRHSSSLCAAPLPPMCAHSAVALEWGGSTSNDGALGVSVWVHGGLQPDPRVGAGRVTAPLQQDWKVSSRSFLLDSVNDREGGGATELSHTTSGALQVPLSLKRWAAGAIGQRDMELFGHCSAAIPAVCLPFSYDSLLEEWEHEFSRQRTLLLSRQSALGPHNAAVQCEGSRDTKVSGLKSVVRLRELRCAVALTVGGCTSLPSFAQPTLGSQRTGCPFLSARHLLLPSSATVFEPRVTLVMVAVEENEDDDAGPISPQSPRSGNGFAPSGIWRWSMTQPLAVTSESSVSPRAFATLTPLRDECNAASFLLFGGTTNGSTPCEGASVPLLLHVDVAERALHAEPFPTLGVPPEGRYGHSLTSMRGGRLLVLHGGIGRDRRVLGDTFVLDHTTRVWTEVVVPIPLMLVCGGSSSGSCFTCRRAFHAAVAVDEGNGILFLGGDDGVDEQRQDWLRRLHSGHGRCGVRSSWPRTSLLSWGPPTLQWTCSQGNDFCRGEWRRVVFPLLRSSLATTPTDASRVRTPDSAFANREPRDVGAEQTSPPFASAGPDSHNSSPLDLTNNGTKRNTGDTIRNHNNRSSSAAEFADEKLQDALHVLLESCTSPQGQLGRPHPLLSDLSSDGVSGAGGAAAGHGDVVDVFSALCHGVGCAACPWDSGAALLVGGSPQCSLSQRAAISVLPCRRGTLREQLAMWLLKSAQMTRAAEALCETNRDVTRREACARRAEAASRIRRELR